MSTTKAFIFDLDGVIVDTAKYHYLAWKETANKLSYDFSHSDNEKLKGISRVNSLDLILSWADITLEQSKKDILLIEKNEIYLDYVAQLTTADILPGVMEMFDRLDTLNIKIGLGSASKNARPILSKLNIMNRFATIIDGTDITKSKPDPEVFAKGADDLGVDYASCLVLEDSQSGIEAAQTIHMKTIAVGTAEELSNADYQYASLDLIDNQLLDTIITA